MKLPFAPSGANPSSGTRIGTAGHGDPGHGDRSLVPPVPCPTDFATASGRVVQGGAVNLQIKPAPPLHNKPARFTFQYD